MRSVVTIGRYLPRLAGVKYVAVRWQFREQTGVVGVGTIEMPRAARHVDRMRGRLAFAVDLALSLAGPSPWWAAGRVRFMIARVSGRISFLTLGDEPERRWCRD